MQALMSGDESYARNIWYYAFLDALRDLLERGSNPSKLFLNLYNPDLSNKDF
jgi:tryptophanase